MFDKTLLLAGLESLWSALSYFLNLISRTFDV